MRYKLSASGEKLAQLSFFQVLTACVDFSNLLLCCTNTSQNIFTRNARLVCFCSFLHRAYLFFEQIFETKKYKSAYLSLKRATCRPIDLDIHHLFSYLSVIVMLVITYTNILENVEILICEA